MIMDSGKWAFSVLYCVLVLSSKDPFRQLASAFIAGPRHASSGKSRQTRLQQHRQTATTLPEGDVDPKSSRFSRREYWNDIYKTESNFSWYAGWDELRPFVDEFLVGLPRNDTRILVPGVGNDETIVGMHDHGYSRVTALDYAPEGIERCREMLGGARLRDEQRRPGDDNDSDPTDGNGPGVRLVVADARDLGGVFDDDSFDAVFEKGTLDAIFLSGGDDKAAGVTNMNMAISELSRCVKPAGVWMSVAAVAVDQIQKAFDGMDDWDCIVEKYCVYTTEDGFTSNNIDGALLVWRRRPV